MAQTQHLAAALLLAGSLPLTASASMMDVNAMFVFGDSLLDGGNSGLATGGFPPPPYAGGRYSNGPTAVEQLWTNLSPGSALLPSLAGGTNFAIGGATTGQVNYNAINPNVPAPLQPAFADRGMAWQLGEFQNYVAANGPFDPSSTLFVIWAFPNDLFYNAATGLLPGTVPFSPGGANVVENAITNILTTIQLLSSVGGQHFLVANSADLGMTPELRGTPLQGAASFASAIFNENLAQQLTVLDSLLPGEIYQVDVAAIVADAMANPAAYGFSNATDSCVAALLTTGLCDPASWLFWDGVHPTARAHSVLAAAFAAAIPEPSTLALLGLSFLSMAAAGRRQHQRAV
ncbi:MAG: SGNH/GDSL hydrolase family protein [Gammaproteobacteria bacterium]|nr:SGNH/GDSL hydrolase family protein [Gammaproteobacteria bacterium]